MRNTDFITLKQCEIYSAHFPTDDVISRVENMRGHTKDGFLRWETVTNPINGKKVTQLSNGNLFFSVHFEWVNFSKALLEHQIWQLKKLDESEVGNVVGMSEKEIVSLAKEMLMSLDLPSSSEIVNFFYCADTHHLIVNSRSPRARIAISDIVTNMSVVEFRTFVVSEEKLGLTAKLTALLTENKPMFNHLNFANRVTLYRAQGEYQETRTHLDCAIRSDEPESKARVIQALQEGYRVQSAKFFLWDESGKNEMSFTLTSRLKINKIKFFGYDRMKSTVSTNSFGKYAEEFEDYIARQFEALDKVVKGVLLGFVEGTKLEDNI
ncbi:hypothetical protein E5343_06945 [Rodentibacter caecimuris]|uniref:hypothetical protein n=1 Tax=Rodentibacter caecimuris TaxID=1796644 RepID=UPI0010942CDB|nr:hypothetical protein [Pasteurella caecimuris]TGY49712.1 hypothetical protein E5343_06945 [Pasteurella caecimuris]